LDFYSHPYLYSDDYQYSNDDSHSHQHLDGHLNTLDDPYFHPNRDGFSDSNGNCNPDRD
jgi:hypothetical protein